MIKTLTLLFSLFSLTAFAQYPGGEQSIGNNNNVVKAKGGFTAGGGIIVKTYTTTTDANATPIKDYPGAIIFTTSDNQYWVRNSAATEWLPIFQNAGNCDLRTGGLVTWSGVGLTYNVTSASFCIGGNGYSFPGGSITLDIADPSYPRFDVIGLDNTGNLIKITGTPSTNPQVPTVNPATQLYLTAVLVNAGATTPNGVSQIVLWDENLDSPSEWTAGTTATANFNNTLSTYHLVKSADVTNGVDGTSIRFNGTPAATNDYNAVRFYVKLKTALSIRQNFIVVLEIDNTSNDVSLPVTLSTAYGFNKNLTGVYQNITIPLSDFGASGNISAFVLKHSIDGLSAPIEYYFDYLTLISGTTIPTGGITNISKKAGTDSIFFFKNGIWQFAFKDSVGTGGGGGTDYVNAGWGVEVDSVGRNYTVKVDSNAIKGLDLGSDTVLVEQPLYVDADTLKFNVDSSGLVRDAMRSNDSVYLKINGEWVFAFIDSVGSSGGGSVEYVLQGWGIKVDSTGRNYTVKADSSVLATLYKVQQDSLAIVGNMWKLGGNTGINDSTKFIGTTDRKALNFRVNGRRSGFIDSTSTNTIFGYGALQNVTTGLTSVAIGYEALKANTTGQGNTAVGYRALLSNTTGSSNFAAGREALRSNTTGGGNFGMGFFALYSNVSGSNNIAIGNSALNSNTWSGNVAIGTSAGGSNTTGAITAIGFEALTANTTGQGNTAIGSRGLFANTTGHGNTVVGNNGLYANTTGQGNTAVGNNGMWANTTGQGNTAIGNNALYSNGNSVAALGTITGGSGYTNGTYTNVSLNTIPANYFLVAPIANITVSGGAVTAVSMVSGGAGIAAVTSLTASAADIGGTGSGFSVAIAAFTEGGNYSTAIGDSAAANQRRGNANIAVGPHVALPDTAAGKQLNIGNVIFGTGTYDGTSMSSTATSDSRVSIGTNTQPASAILTLSSTDKGFLPPRMTGSQAEAIASPAEGLMIYSTDGSGSTITSKGWWGYDGAAWKRLDNP